MLDGHLCFFFFEEVSIQMFFLVFLVFWFLGWVHLLLLSCKTLDFLGRTPVCGVLVIVLVTVTEYLAEAAKGRGGSLCHVVWGVRSIMAGKAWCGAAWSMTAGGCDAAICISASRR